MALGRIDLLGNFRAGRKHAAARRTSSSPRQRDDAAALQPPPVEPFLDFFDSAPLPEELSGGGDAGHQKPPAFDGDDLAECKAVLAGYVEENARLKATIEQWRGAVAERDERIAAFVGERDRGHAAVNNARAQIGELESIIAFPGVKNALRKALHPDTGAGGDVSSRTAIFQTLNAVLKRLGLG